MGMAMTNQHRPDDMVAGDEKFHVNIVADGTLTRVQVTDPDGELLGEGLARRKKGDRRNEDLGLALAAHRAFQAVADEYLAIAKEKGYFVERRKRQPKKVVPLVLPAAFEDVLRSLADAFVKE